MIRCTLAAILLLGSLLLGSPASAVTTTTYNSTKDLDAGAIDYTTPVNSQVLYLAQVAVNFSAAPEAAETITVDVVNQIGQNFAINVLKYAAIAGNPTALTLIANAAIPVAVGSAIRVRVTNASQSVGESNDDPTAYVTVTMDSTERTGEGLTLSVNGKIAQTSTPQTDGIGTVASGVPPGTYVLKAGDSMQGPLAMDNAQPIRWLEATAGGTNIVAFQAPATLGADRVCVFQDAAAPIPDSCVGDGTDAGGTVNTFSTVAVPLGSNVLADSPTDTLTMTFQSPFKITGDSATDTLAFAINTQTANTLYAGPTSGGPAAPAFRVLVDNDVPDTVTATNYVLKAGDIMTGPLTLDNAQPTRWREATAGGTNHIAFVAPATIASDRTCTFQDSSSPIPDSCVGNGVDDAGSGGTASNSFETMNAPTGTDPVADSATDTLNWTIDAPFTLTGDSTTDTMAFGIPVQTANTFYAGPTTGAAAAPAFRALVDNDVPDTVTATNYVLKAGDTMTGPLWIANGLSLRLMEDTTSGTNYIWLAAPGTLAANRTCIMQDAMAPIPDSCVGDGTDAVGLVAETDPTLTNDGAVTIGSGAVDPTTLTFDSDAGTDGTLSWTGATDAFQMNGNLGIGGPPAASYPLHVNKNVTSPLYITNQNANASGVAVFRAESDTTAVNINAYGSTFAGTIFGQSVAGMGGLFDVTGNGLMIGGIPAGKPVFIGAGNTLAQTITDADTTVHGILNVSPTGYSSARLGQRLSTDNAGNYGGAAFTTWSAGSALHSAFFEINRSRSSTMGTHTIVQSGDSLGYIIFRGSDGAAFQSGGWISASVDGTPGANDMPGRLSLNTTPDGGVTPNERVRIDSAGRVGIGTVALNTDSRLEIEGHLTFEGSPPVVSACGTSPSIVGTDVAGKVTTGSGTVTSCVLTFATQWATTPACVVSEETAAVAIRGVTSTAALVIAGADISSDVIHYICMGRG